MTLATRTLKALSFDEAAAFMEQGAAYVDLRPIPEYLDVHIPGSIALLYEMGPGMATRARDCLPLSVPLILLGDDHADEMHAAASLRGKGFVVLGALEDGINAWAQRHGAPASTDVYESTEPPSGNLLDVNDSGAPRVETARRVSIERLWDDVGEVVDVGRLIIVAGYGVRAAIAIGILERAGARNLGFWKRPRA